MHLDPYILAFSALTVFATIWMGFWAARKSKTAHDFFVAGRLVSVSRNAPGDFGAYTSLAPFKGDAGHRVTQGDDVPSYTDCYARADLFLLLLNAHPSRL